MKHCREYQQLLLPHLYDVLEPDEQRELEEHLTECLECRAALERARQEQTWLREACRWSFEPVRFEAPALEPASSKTTEAFKSAGRFWVDWVQENAPLWTLAASLLLAISLAVWWATSFNRENADWAAAPGWPRERPAEVQAGQRVQDSEKDLAPRIERHGVLPAERQGTLSPARQAQASTWCDNAQDRATERNRPGSAVESPPPSTSFGQALRGGGDTERTVLEKAKPLLQAAGGAPNPTMKSHAEQGHSAPAVPAAGREFRRRDSSALNLCQFTVLRVSPVQTAEGMFLTVGIDDLSCDGVDNSKASAVASALPASENNSLGLVVPESAHSTTGLSQGKIGPGRPLNAASGQAAQNLASPTPSSPGLDGGASQVGNVVRQNLPQVMFSQEFLARLPQTDRATRRVPFGASVEVPIFVGHLSEFVSMARLSLEERPYVMALRLEREADGQKLRIQILPLDARRLIPSPVSLAVSAQFLTDQGQPLGEKVMAILAPQGVHAREQTDADRQRQVGGMIYEAQLTWPKHASQPCWLQLQEERKLLPTVSLRLKPVGEPAEPNPGKPDKPAWSPGQSRLTAPETQPGERADTVSTQPSDEHSGDAFDWNTAICCAEPQLALHMAILARRESVPSLERSVYERVRAHVRKQLQESNVPVRSAGTRMLFPLSLAVPSTHPRQASWQISEFFLQMIPKQERWRYWLVVIATGASLALGGLALACGIFGAVSGRWAYLFWSRRLFGATALLLVLWWTWANVSAQARSEQVPARSLQTVPSASSSLARSAP
ncbi:MAG: zf-HC2 domain-containing protein [Gemmatales bacterium]|nr:zf-HC2 domain-containing protein [Gemmatales bacterium]